MGNMTTLQILQGVHDWVLDKIDEETASFITKTVNDLVNYYTKTETYTKAEVQQIVNAIKQFTYEVVQVLPTASASTMNKIYLVPAPKSEDKNVKEEYITIQDGSTYSWEMLGTTSIDLSNYYTKGQTDSAISSALSSALSSYTTTADLTTLLAQKQDVIQDLADIRSGASAGSTAVQPSTLNDVVKDVVAESGVYDVSANNDNTKFESLSALLSSANLNTLIPTDIRKGGMSIKFIQLTPATYSVVKTEGLTEQPTGTEVQEALAIDTGTYTAAQLPVDAPATTATYWLSVTETVEGVETTTYTTWVITKVTSDKTEYVQYRLMSTDWSNVVTDWQGVDSEPTAGSRNLVESGAVEKLNHPYIDPVTIQTGEELTIGTRYPTKVTITKDGGEFTIVKTVTEFTGGLGYYIGLLDYDYTKQHFLYVDYEYTKKGANTASIDIRVDNTSTNDTLCASHQMEVGAHSAKIALPKTLQGKYITCNFNNLGGNGTTVVLRNIRVAKEDDSTIREKFDGIDKAVNEISDRIDNNYEDVKGHIAAISGSLYEKLSLHSYTYAINIDGKYGTSTTYKHQALPVVAGEQYYIHIAPGHVFRYAFATDHAYSAGADVSLVENTEVVWYGIDNEDKIELLITIPESCNFLLFFNTSFVYKITPSRVDEIYKKADNISDTVKVLGETCAYREWQALSMYNNYKFKLTINDSIATVNSGTSNQQTLAFIPVKKDDVYRFTVEDTNINNSLMVALFDEPPVSAGIEGELLYCDYYQDGVLEAIVKVPKDGYLARYVYLQSTSMKLYEYKLAENGFCEDIYVKKEQTISYTNDSLIVIDPKSANFGEVLTGVTNNNYKTSDFIPVDNTKYIKMFSRKSVAGFAVTSYLNNTFGYLFYDEDKKPIAWSGIPVETYTIGVVKNQNYAIHAVPTNAAYIRVTEYKDNGLIYFLKEKISELNFKEAKDYTGSLAQAKFVTSSPTIQSLGLVHFSDIHGDQTSADAIKKFIGDYSQYITDVLCTGDSVHYYADGISGYPQGSTWWKETSGLANKALFVLGNHDSATPASTEYDQKEDSAAWDGKGKDWCFTTYIEPYIETLGYVMPDGYDDSASPNYHACYWHKDFAAQKIRIIGLDCLHRFDGIVDPVTGAITTAGLKWTTNEQELWLIEKLNETLDSNNAAYGYSVIVACHYPIDNFSGDNEEWDDTTHKFTYNQKTTGGRVMDFKTGDVVGFHYGNTTSYSAVVKFNMNNRVDNGYSQGQPYPNYTQGTTNNIANIINTWMNSGGKFVAWICGHTHADYMWYPTKYPNILCVVLDQAGCLRGTNTGDRSTNLDSRVCANYYSIDTQNGLFKIVRVGYTMNKLMNSHEYLCYDYINRKVLNEG